MKIAEAKQIVKRHYDIIEEWTQFEQEAYTIAKQMYSIEMSHNGRSFEFDRVIVLEGNVTVIFTGYSCGDTDYYEYSFPIEWLDDPDWRAKYTQRLSDERAERVKIIAQAEAEKLSMIARATMIADDSGRQGIMCGTPWNNWIPVQWNGELAPTVARVNEVTQLYPDDAKAMHMIVL